MHTFYWQGINRQGNYQQGSLLAKNKKIAQSQLQNQQISIITLRKKSLVIHLKKDVIKQTQLTDFTTQLADLLNAGITLTDALALLITETRSPTYRQLLTEIKNSIEHGYALYQALSEHPKQFSATDIALVQAGEQSSQLTTCLSQLSRLRLARQQINMKISKAAIYPITVIITAILISLGLILFAIPQLQTMFVDFAIKLPLFTRLLINICDMIRQNFLFFLLLLLSTTLLIYYFSKKSQRIRKIFDKVCLMTPKINQLLLMKDRIIWCSIVSTLLQSGIPLIESLNIAKQAFSNSLLKNKAKTLIDSVKQGESLHVAMQHSALFTSKINSMVYISEQSGNLSQILNTISKLEMTALQYQIDLLSRLIEPLIMVLLALIAGAIIFALYLPIFHIGAAL